MSTFEWHKINTWQVDSYWHEYLTSRQLLTRISDKSTVNQTNIWQVDGWSTKNLFGMTQILNISLVDSWATQICDKSTPKNPQIIRQNPLTFRQFIDRHKDITNQKYTSHIERYLTEWEKTTLIFKGLTNHFLRGDINSKRLTMFLSKNRWPSNTRF